MIFSEYARHAAGRWVDRSYRPPVEAPAEPAAASPKVGPVAARVVQDADSREDGTGAWLPAAVISKRDEINISGEWLPVTDVLITAPNYDRPGSAVLDVPGRSLRLDYTALIYARDAAEILGREIGGAR